MKEDEQEDGHRRTPSIRRTKLNRRYYDRRDEEDERRKPRKPPPLPVVKINIEDIPFIPEGDIELLEEIEDDKLR